MEDRLELAERLYKESWGEYQYVPFKDAPKVVRQQYLRKSDRILK